MIAFLLSIVAALLGFGTWSAFPGDSTAVPVPSVIVVATPAALSVAYAGTGPAEGIPLAAGSALIAVTAEGSGPVTIELVVDPTMPRQVVLSRDAGPVNEVVAVDVPMAGVYAIEVTTDGSWTVQVD